MSRLSRHRPTSRLAARRPAQATSALIAVAVVVGLSLPALALAAAISPIGGTVSKFALTGELQGTLSAPKKWNLGFTLTQAGCEKTVDKTSFNVFFYNVKLTLNGRKTTLNGGFQGAAIMLNVEVQKYGTTEPFGNQDVNGAPDNVASANLNVYAGKTFYSWQTNAGSATVNASGTITTNAAGTGGTINATLIPTGTGLPTGISGHETSDITVKGSYADCVQFKG